MNNLKRIFVVIALLTGLVLLAGMYKFNMLSGQPGFDVDGNPIEPGAESGMVLDKNDHSKQPRLH